jgi:molecular chaperone GrpE
MSDDQERVKPTSNPDGSSTTAGEATASVAGGAADEVFAQAAGEMDSVSPLAATQAELDDMRQKYVRLQAELENFRKRMMRSMEEERRYADLPLLRDLLPVVDNLQRAISAAEKHENAAGLLDGVKMVADQLSGVLERRHCSAIEALGTPFDPHLHEAIAQHPNPDYAPGHVCLVTQVGYLLHDRVIRPSQVIVAAAPPSAEDASTIPDPQS